MDGLRFLGCSHSAFVAFWTSFHAGSIVVLSEMAAHKSLCKNSSLATLLGFVFVWLALWFLQRPSVVSLAYP